MSEEELSEYYRSRHSHHSSEIKLKWDYSESKFSLVYCPLLNKIESLASSGRLLDIGCSNGSFVRAASRVGWEACGLELESDSFELARSQGVTVYNSELSELDFPENSFSAVTMWQVIEHVHSPASLITEIARILKPGGVLAVSTPNIKSLGWRLLREDWGAVEPQVHLHLFQPSGLARLMNDCGLKTREVRTLDIQPVTMKSAVKKMIGRSSVRPSGSVAALAGSNAGNAVRLLFNVRPFINLSLNALGIGEDIYGYFSKTYPSEIAGYLNSGK